MNNPPSKILFRYKNYSFSVGVLPRIHCRRVKNPTLVLETTINHNYEIAKPVFKRGGVAVTRRIVEIKNHD